MGESQFFKHVFTTYIVVGGREFCEPRAVEISCSNNNSRWGLNSIRRYDTTCSACCTSTFKDLFAEEVNEKGASEA